MNIITKLFNGISNMFRKEHIRPELRESANIYSGDLYIWGHNVMKYKDVEITDTHRIDKITGILNPLLRIGDGITFKGKSGRRVLWIFIRVEGYDNVKNMFNANIKVVKYCDGKTFNNMTPY